MVQTSAFLCSGPIRKSKQKDRPVILGKRAVGKGQQGKAAAQHERPGGQQYWAYVDSEVRW